MEKRMKFEKLSIKHLGDSIIGKHIKDSNIKEYVKVIDFREHDIEAFYAADLEKEYANYGKEVDVYMLLRNFDIEVNNEEI